MALQIDVTAGHPHTDRLNRRAHGASRTANPFMAEGYCVKCKAKKGIARRHREPMKNGRKAIKGNHHSGTVMFKILGKLDFFKRNIGKRDINMHNRYLLETIHKKMNISNDDFDVFKGFFAIVMRERMIEEGLIADFLIFLEHFRKDIVSELSVLQKAYSEIPEFENILLERFIERIKKNQIVSQYFANKDSAFQIEHCKAVINFILNSRKGDFDLNLRTFHQNCEISDHAFYFF